MGPPPRFQVYHVGQHKAKVSSAGLGQMEPGGSWKSLVTGVSSPWVPWPPLAGGRCLLTSSNLHSMTCARCNHGFCWRCLKSWKPSHKDYYNCSAMVRVWLCWSQRHSHSRPAVFGPGAELCPQNMVSQDKGPVGIDRSC